jgi:hypothetical protein
MGTELKGTYGNLMQAKGIWRNLKDATRGNNEVKAFCLPGCRATSYSTPKTVSPSYGHCYKTFYGRKLRLFIIARAFVPGNPFQPSLMFGGHAGTYPSDLSEPSFSTFQYLHEYLSVPTRVPFSTYPSTFQVLHSRVGSWIYTQTSDLLEKACREQAL